MTLTKKKMVREIGRRTRLTNREVRAVVDTLIDVWTEALVSGEKIEIENFIVLEVLEIDRGANTGNWSNTTVVPRKIRRVSVRASKSLRVKLK